MMIHSQLVSDPKVVPLGMVFFVAPILATLFIFPLFAFSINLIIKKDESFGYDDSSFKRKLLFVLMALQFLPTIIGLGLMVSTSVPNGHSNMLLVEQFIANMLFSTSAMVLKFGNYEKDDDSF